MDARFRAAGHLPWAHLIVDCYTNVYAPLLPLLIPKLGLRLAAAGVLAMVFQIAASVSQLAFGRLADRWHPHRLLIGGPIVTVLALSLIGVAPTTAWLAVCCWSSAAWARRRSIRRARCWRIASAAAAPASAMSLFVGGGAIGFALAPLMFATVTARFGLRPPCG